MICLAVGQQEVAVFVRRVLRHRLLNTKAKRMGNIIRATHTGLRVWRLSVPNEIEFRWED